MKNYFVNKKNCLICSEDLYNFGDSKYCCLGCKYEIFTYEYSDDKDCLQELIMFDIGNIMVLDFNVFSSKFNIHIEYKVSNPNKFQRITLDLEMDSFIDLYNFFLRFEDNMEFL